jgi:hypothetical protein
MKAPYRPAPSTNGYEDAREHYPDGVLEGEVKACAERLVDEALENQDLTDETARVPRPVR